MKLQFIMFLCLGSLFICGQSYSQNTPEIIDLGLSVKWADRNVGANSPTEIGYYFAWGEVTPKNTYNWDNYAFGRRPNIRKYNSDSSYGTVDHKTILEKEDDAAYVAYGEGWRMPTNEELQELRRSASVNSYKIDGVMCMNFSRNGKSISLPYGGKCGGGVIDEGEDLYVWSSTLGSFSNRAYSMHRHSGYLTSIHYRYLGFPIRAVYDDSQNNTSIKQLDDENHSIQSITTIDGRKCDIKTKGILIIRKVNGKVLKIRNR